MRPAVAAPNTAQVISQLYAVILQHLGAGLAVSRLNSGRRVMARNLSERLLDMVEDDARFMGLEPATVIVWLKLVRLFHRAGSRRPETPGYSFSHDELTRFLRVTQAELAGHIDVLTSRRLLMRCEEKVFAPPECRYFASSRPAPVANRFVPQLIPIGRR
jgi:hypothetical protein